MTGGSAFAGAFRPLPYPESFFVWRATGPEIARLRRKIELYPRHLRYIRVTGPDPTPYPSPAS